MGYCPKCHHHVTALRAVTKNGIIGYVGDVFFEWIIPRNDPTTKFICMRCNEIVADDLGLAENIVRR